MVVREPIPTRKLQILKALDGRLVFDDTLQSIDWACDFIEQADKKIADGSYTDTDLRLITVLSTFLMSFQLGFYDGVVIPHPYAHIL